MSIWLAGMLWAGLSSPPVMTAPPVCPKELGQIQWSDISHSFKAGKRRYVLQGSLWDRDTNGKPSSGDLMRVESLNINGRDAGASEVWVVLKGQMAKSVGRSVRKQSDSITAQCTSRFEVKGVTKVSSPGAFARYLNQVANGGEDIDPLDEVRADMGTWAETMCKRSKKHLSEEALSKALFKKAKRAHRKIRKGNLKAVADETAAQYAVACARLDQGTLR
ncbi:MAG: hypothetical protein ACE366_13545 [Bradymonadia bacterium]